MDAAEYKPVVLGFIFCGQNPQVNPERDSREKWI